MSACSQFMFSGSQNGFSPSHVRPSEWEQRPGQSPARCGQGTAAPRRAAIEVCIHAIRDFDLGLLDDAGFSLLPQQFVVAEDISD